jgi:hypothetical protein
MEEAGVPGVDRRLLECLRRKTPRAIIGLSNRHLNSILQEPEARTTFLAQGYDPAGGSPEIFTACSPTKWRRGVALFVRRI